MGQSTKAVLQLLLIVLGLATLLIWQIPPHPNAAVWGARVGCTLGFVGVIWLLWRVSRRREALPDLLGKAAGSYFERDGFCFAFAPVVAQGQCWMQVFFQNRYERPCRGRFVLKPPARNFSLGRWPLPTVDVEVDCDGAAFGVHRQPWPIPTTLQGKLAKCEVAGAVRYPAGRGRLMRYREGMRTGTPGGDVGRAVATLGMAAVGGLYISRPANVKIRLPTGAAAAAEPGTEPVTQILWRPDVPTGGFPVLPVEAGEE